MKYSELEKKRNRLNKNYTVSLVGFIFGFVLTSIIAQYAGEKNQQDKEKTRSESFAKYILDDVHAGAVKNADMADISAESQMYGARADDATVAAMMQDLSADSAYYADAIVRDADIINRMDKNITFDQAMEYIAHTPKYKPGHEPAAGIHQVTHQVSDDNLSAAGKIMMNRAHLQNICTELIIARRAQSMAK